MSCMAISLNLVLGAEEDDLVAAAKPAAAAAVKRRPPAEERRRVNTAGVVHRFLRDGVGIDVGRRLERVLHGVAGEPDELARGRELAILGAQAFELETERLTGHRSEAAADRSAERTAEERADRAAG